MAHDFAQQKAETFSAFADLDAKEALPDSADLDLFFVSDTDGRDWRPLAAALADLGFECDWIDAEDQNPGYLVATLTDQPISASSIWMIEELASRAALDKGFRPDGWGFSD